MPQKQTIATFPIEMTVQAQTPNQADESEQRPQSASDEHKETAQHERNGEKRRRNEFRLVSGTIRHKKKETRKLGEAGWSIEKMVNWSELNFMIRYSQAFRKCHCCAKRILKLQQPESLVQEVIEKAVHVCIVLPKSHCE